MEDFTIPHEPAKNSSISVIEDEKEKVKDFVYKHFREVTDGPLFNISEESPIKEHGSSTKKDKPTLKAHCKVQQGAVFSGKILSFGCSVCKDDFTFSPNDLLKHFRAAHHGSLPTYPCDLCDFVTNEFPALQRHRIEHRNTLVTCELCNNGVQYSLLLLTRHYIMCHSINGHFKCDWCEFTTVDAGTFVQHIHHHNESHWKCSKCRHISLNEEDHQNHMKAHLDTFPFTCQICGFGAPRREKLRKHTASVHKGEAERRNALKSVDDSGSPANSTNVIRFKKSGDSQEAQRMSEQSHLSGSVPNRNGRLIKPELFLEETNHFMDGTVAKRDSRSWSKSFHNTEHSTPVMLQECDNFLSSDVGSHISANGLTVVMVKNKISLPPNCTTKVMGFKMVDGKKHLVLKVIPTEKQDLSTQNHSIVDSVGPLVSHPVLGKSKASVENGQCSNCKSSTSHCLAVSTTCVSCLQMDQDDIMAVKVKVEEEETSVCNFNSTPHTSNDGEQTNLVVNRPLTPAATLHPVTNELYHEGDQTYFNETTCGSKESYQSDATSHSISQTNNTTTMSAGRVTSTVVQETLHTCSIPVFRKTLDNCGSSRESPLTDGNNKLFEINKGDSAFHTMDTDPSSQITPEESDGLDIDIKSKNDKQNVKNLDTPIQPSQPSLVSSRESAICTGKGTQNTPNQEVFTFHNYSKEIFSTLPNTTQNFYCNSGDKKTCCESSQFNLTLPESSERLKESTVGDIMIDENIVGVDDPLTEENADTVLQDFNIIKVEEESIPISTKQSETKSSSTYLGNFVEEHSDAIITQQLNKERTGSSIASHESLKQTKTTLRILQLPEGKQPVLLRATNSQFTKPVQVKAAPGFKILTNSTNPQINVSFLKPGLEQSSNTSGLTLTQDTKTIGVPSAKPQAVDQGNTLFSAFKPGVNSTSNHYLISSPGLKGPVLLSSAPQCTPINKMAKTQPACYLVQRSVHLAKSPNTPTLKLPSTQFPLNSRPVLAMPKSSTEKPSTLQTGRQAFLLRYISPHKSGLFLNNQEVKSGTISNQTSESSGNKVILKIVTPTASLPPSGAATSSSQPLFLATRPQTKCFLVSSNKTNASASSGVKRLISIHNAAQKDVKKSNISPSQMNVKVQPCEAEKLMLAPRPIRPPSQRKRRRKALFDELPTTVQKARRLSNKVQSDKETTVLWKPVAKEEERTLRLAPFSLVQQVKCPRRYQPVVVLNHPDADIPEVANIMRVVNRYKGAVTKVSLCQKTVQALSDLSTLGNNSSTKSALANNDNLSTRPVQSTVRERFLLKLKLRKKSKRKYEVVDRGSLSRRQGSVVFDCWFCGRLFNNQEDWVGHGQRHLMEATRDWNKLF
ncbi:zinc finger protein 518A isoform 1-T2 [Odontesthes bonariensis]|uniref:zinc finger protein 518A n=1 Tax=Odontesthes bonariensis TaxID=219752 RepID=UPI003F5844B5